MYLRVMRDFIIMKTIRCCYASYGYGYDHVHDHDHYHDYVPDCDRDHDFHGNTSLGLLLPPEVVEDYSFRVLVEPFGVPLT
jgi:hypothetical protein